MRVVNMNKGYGGYNADSSLYTEPANRDITILDLLTHTSGLSYGYGFGKEGGREGGREGRRGVCTLPLNLTAFPLPPSLPPSLLLSAMLQ